MKVGKNRKDKFYRLAKETGYRSRAAYKLLQLNRKYEFLQRSNVLIDLCAAPGGWLQVASATMPVESHIVGVDLDKIKRIPRVHTIQADITTDACKQELKQILKTAKADVVLNDGAPNIGKDWRHDAFQQTRLVLSGLELATNFLRKGGWFITKLFHSKDFQSMIYVLMQLFDKVNVTKPQASRTESAEQFVVCSGYKAPDKIDRKFFDLRSVFAETGKDSVNKLNLLHPEKVTKHSEGYPDGDYTLHHVCKASTFICDPDYINILQTTSEIVFDDEEILNNPMTTAEIKECCKDIKVLGRREIRGLLKWRKKLNAEMFPQEKKEAVEPKEEEKDEDKVLDEQLDKLAEEERIESKRTKKKELKGKQKTQIRLAMSHVSEPVDLTGGEAFRLSLIKNKQQLAKISQPSMKELDKAVLKESKEISKAKWEAKKKVGIVDTDELWEDEPDKNEDDLSDSEHSSLGNGLEDPDFDDSQDEDSNMEDEDLNPLVVDIDNPTTESRKKTRADIWFSKAIFGDLENEFDEDYEIDKMATTYMEKKEEQQPEQAEKGIDEVPVVEKNKEKVDNYDSSSSEELSSSDEDSEDEVNRAVVKKQDGIEIVSQEATSKKKRVRLDPEGLALATMLIKSKKSKRDIMDSAWNRYAFDDQDTVPDWFANEEKEHSRRDLPVTREMVSEYKERLKEVNVRTIKKVAEAKGRKKRRKMKKLEKARKRAENVIDSIDMTDHEKMSQIKTIYKKANKDKKKEVKYMVSKKGLAGKKIVRPKGLKGRMKLVDPRMKCDDRKRKTMMKTKKGRKQMSKGGRGRGQKGGRGRK